MNLIEDPAHLDRLVERQMRAVAIRRQAAHEAARAARGPERSAPHPAEGPWLTVSKQLGSRGTEIARRVGENLGWHLFDREIVQAIAARTHTREKLLAKLDEHAPGIFEELMARLIPQALTPSDFEREMVQVIWALGRHGSAILLGRGANWLLDPRCGLRVRIVASETERARRVAEREEIGAAEALHRVREDEERRAAFVRKVFRRDLDDPLGYDVVLNSDALTTETTAEIILTALRKKLDHPL